MASQLLLPPPYGYGKGYHVSLHASEDFSEAQTMHVIMEAGCPRRVAVKAISCMRNSGRYDCVMSTMAFENGMALGLGPKLRAAGVELKLRSKPTRSRFFGFDNLYRDLHISGSSIRARYAK